MSNEKYHYESGAIHNDNHKEINIGIVSEKALGRIMSQFLNDNTADVTPDEVSDDAHGVTPKRKLSKLNGEKPPKPRETMTFKCGKNVLDGHLTLLFNKLTQEKWIEGYEANFKALFYGKKDEGCELTWISSFGKGTLVWLFKTLATEELIVVPNGYTIPAILEGHFKDKKGQWLRGLDKGDNPNQKAKPTFIECVKILKINPNGSYDEQNEDVQLRYDPFDHQDLHLHQK